MLNRGKMTASSFIRHGSALRSGSGRTKYWFFIHYLSHARSLVPGLGLRNLIGELSESEKLRRTEAVLFLSRESLTSKKIAKLAGLADATEARTLIRRLNKQYENTGRAYRIEEVASGMTMLTRPAFAPWLRRLAHVPSVIKLSQSAMETLAVVAYRQPVLRADIEAIRGVGCSEVLKQLMDGELVRICGRSEELGRPYLYGTTKRFLQIFGLRNADRLPRSDWVNSIWPASQPAPQNLESTFEHDPGTSSEAKESTVKMSFSATALKDEQPQDEIRDSLLSTRVVRAGVDDDDDDDFEDDDDDDEEDDFEDDEEEFEDEEFEDDEEVVEDAEELEEDEEFEDEEGDEEDDWEEVDDEDDEEWDDDDDEDDDWDDDDEEDEEEWD